MFRYVMYFSGVLLWMMVFTILIAANWQTIKRTASMYFRPLSWMLTPFRNRRARHQFEKTMEDHFERRDALLKLAIDLRKKLDVYAQIKDKTPIQQAAIDDVQAILNSTLETVDAIKEAQDWLREQNNEPEAEAA